MNPQTWRVTVMAISVFRALKTFGATPLDALRSRAYIPQHAGCFRGLEMFLPFPAKPNFVHPVRGGERRYQDRQRKHGQRCRLLLKHGRADTVNVGGEFRIRSLAALYPALPRAEAGEEFAHRACALHFGIGAPHAGDGVRIATADADLPEPLRQSLRLTVGAAPHLSVA